MNPETILEQHKDVLIDVYNNIVKYRNAFNKYMEKLDDMFEKMEKVDNGDNCIISMRDFESLRNVKQPKNILLDKFAEYDVMTLNIILSVFEGGRDPHDNSDEPLVVEYHFFKNKWDLLDVITNMNYRDFKLQYSVGLARIGFITGTELETSSEHVC